MKRFTDAENLRSNMECRNGHVYLSSSATNSMCRKRSVLSCIASLFDPLQFLSLFTIRGKLLTQEIWAAGLDWDDVLPGELDSKFKTWISEFQELPNFTIPRCLRYALPTSIQLHMFSDASKAAYVAVAYLV